MEQMLENDQLILDEDLLIKEGFEINGKYGDWFLYWGQVNSENEYHGIGRLETADGRIVEG